MADKGEERDELDGHLALSAVLDGLHDQLWRSTQTRPAGWRPLFRVSEAVVELQVRVAEDVEGKAGVKFYVVSLGGSSKVGTQITHKVTLHLEPYENAKRKATGKREATLADPTSDPLAQGGHRRRH